MKPVISLDHEDDHEPAFLFRDAEFFYVANSYTKDRMRKAKGTERLSLADIAIRLSDGKVVKSRFFPPARLTEPTEV